MIYAVDAIMGTGKTSFGIQKLIELIKNKEKVIYITPYKNEIKRVMEECKKAGVSIKQPLAFKGRGKRDNLVNMMVKGENIIATHSCFDGLSKEYFHFIRNNNYILIMDEVHNVVQPLSLTKDDRDLLKSRFVIINEETNEVIWRFGENDYDGRFSDVKSLCDLGNIYYLSDKLCYWVFPCEVFKIMKDVYILTYLFEGQIQSAYYKSCGIDYQLKSIINTNSKRGMEGKYELIDYNPELEKEVIEKYKSLLNIYDGKMNDYDSMTSYSSSYFERIKKNKPEVIKQIKKNIYNYFFNITKSKSNENMWTTLKSIEEELKGKGYTKGFVEMTARATNEFADKTSLAYIYNRYVNPCLITFFTKRGVELNQDLYAVSELLQWIFRSQIRKELPINIYIPSKRMRELLIKWTNGELY